MRRKAAPPAVPRAEVVVQLFPTYAKTGAQSDTYGIEVARGVKVGRTRSRYSLPKDGRTGHAIYLTDAEKHTPRSSAAPGQKGSSLTRSSPEPRIRSGQD